MDFAKVANKNITHVANQSYWPHTIDQPLKHDALNKYIITGVLVIGGGISNLTTSLSLLKEGK